MELFETPDGLKAILELDAKETKWWRAEIGKIRKQTIPPPTVAVERFFEQSVDHKHRKIQPHEISDFIAEVRTSVWAKFIEYEVSFFSEAIGVLLENREAPKTILQSILTTEIVDSMSDSHDTEGLRAAINDIFKDYSGRIFPYFYELSKSQTNSRRARAGSEFEAIIDQIMKRLEIPYDSQSQLGQKTFDKKGLGKKVDGVIPSMDAFNANRSRCIIATMKTTIRERWQEVVEELNRTNIPSIHLLTLDETITENTLSIMKNHNITLVTYSHVKSQFPSFTNVMSFETFFGEEIPHTLDWWSRNQLT